jgi:integrase
MQDNHQAQLVSALPSDGEEKYEEFFKFEGRQYRIFKRREQSRDANWWIRFERRGRVFWRSLDTPRQVTAVMNAKVLVGAVKRENWAAVEGTKLKRDVPSRELGEVFAVYRRNLEGLDSRTVRENMGALANILRRTLGPEVNVEGLPVSALNGQLVRKYKAAVDAEDAAAPELELQRRRRTANSYLRQARSIFAEQQLEHYRDAGLELPAAALEEFKSVPMFSRCEKKDYNPPDDAVIAATFRSLEEKLRLSDRPAYLAVCLAVGAGLRKSEIGECRWSWFVQRNGRAFIRGDMVPKGGEDMDVPILQEWWERIKAMGNGQWAMGDGSSDFVIPGNERERQDGVFRRIGTWMDGLGWKTQKKVHEFRAYVISKIVMEHGIEAGRQFARHGSSRTTEEKYGRYRTVAEIDVKVA